MRKGLLVLILKIVISALFLLSAVAKSFPIWAFEKQLWEIGMVDPCQAHYLARLIIALEMAIAIAILQKHYLKSFVIPVTIALLCIFCIHLGIQMYQYGAMNGNCGCFGQLIPMTPLEAFIKNLVTLAILIYLYKNVTDLEKGQNRFLNILFMYTLSALIMFFFFPFAPCQKENALPKINLPVILPDTLMPAEDSAKELNDTVAAPIKLSDTAGKVHSATDTSKKTSNAPRPVVSRFSEFTDFSGRTVNLDQGQKIVCLFVPGCDHCRHAAKGLVALSKKMKLPPGYIIFMNEELFKLEEFYKETGVKYPYYVLDNIPKFFKLLGNGSTSTPGVFYLWNGNIIKAFEGTGEHEFKANELGKVISSGQNAPGPNAWW
jgi:hypothetical protein